MPLKTRITLLVVLAAAALGALGAAVAWQRDRDLTSRYHLLLLQAQRIAWTKLQSEASAELGAAQARLLESPAWAAAWASQDREGLGALLEPVVRPQAGWRADVLDRRRALAYTSSAALQPEPLVDSAWAARVLEQGQPVSGLSQASRGKYYWVVARRFGQGGQAGVLALAVDASTLLPQLAAGVGGEGRLLNLRGRDIGGGPPRFAGQADLGLRTPNAVDVRDDAGRALLGLVEPLAGADGRQIGALLTLHDVSAQRAADLRTAWTTAAVAAAFLLLLAGLVFAYLRRALQPLERSVGVLGRLSRGDLDAALDDADEAKRDEAGEIARGVSTLRLEMLNLQMLREERTRIRQQQERLIRRQLKLLAESLDEDSRAEILRSLEPEAGSAPAADGGNELADLASILGRMSGLVTTQQGRLIDLLRELRAAMAQQEALVSLRQELEIAHRMQQSILPRSAPQTQAVQVGSLMIPAKEIGGDFYDYFLVDERRLALVVADVSGKGVPAAFFMAISRTLLKANALYLHDPAEAITRLNGQLCAENEQMMFVTAFFAVLDLESGDLAYVNAGHNPPVIRRAGGGVEVLPSGLNPALAVVEDIVYSPGRCALAPGDALLLYTDGVTEATNAQGGLFGEAALVEVVRAGGTDAGEMPQDVLRAVRGFEDGAAQADDITCVALRYRGGA